jgi:hypothetical protein
LQDAQQLGAAQCPTIPEQDVVLLLDANARQFPQDIQLVGQLLKLDEFDVPVALLLCHNALQSHSRIAVPAAGVMKNDVYLFHQRDSAIRFFFANQSILDAMWIIL